MKTTRTFLLAAATGMALFLASPSATAHAPGEKEVHINAKNFDKLSSTEQQQVLDLQARMTTLLATDRSTLSKAERQALRTEWRSMKGEMEHLNREGSVLYISTAGLIIIILLLIILL